MNRQALFLSMIILFAVVLPPKSLSNPQASKALGASEAARAFYQYHFSHGQCYVGACLNRRRKWLTAELYNLLKYEQQRELPPDIVPYIEGDPFTNSQESPHSFRIGKSERHGNGVKVKVFVYWLEKRRVVEQREYSFVMIRESGSWKIADIIDNKGESLRNELRELKRKDSQPRGAA
jgi:hypothetical protein